MEKKGIGVAAGILVALAWIMMTPAIGQSQAQKPGVIQ